MSENKRQLLGKLQQLYEGPLVDDHLYYRHLAAHKVNEFWWEVFGDLVRIVEKKQGKDFHKELEDEITMLRLEGLENGEDE